MYKYWNECFNTNFALIIDSKEIFIIKFRSALDYICLGLGFSSSECNVFLVTIVNSCCCKYRNCFSYKNKLSVPLNIVYFTESVCLPEYHLWLQLPSRAYGVLIEGDK